MADTIIIPDVGKQKFLDFMLGLDLAENLSLRLFVNDVDFTTSPEDLTATDFTEMSTHGYAAKTLTMSTWDATTISSTKAISQYNSGTALSWTFTAATTVSVYGYYVQMASTTTLLWACKFASSKPITYANEQISVVPELRFTKTA